MAARLEVDGHYVATLHWSDAGLVLPETLHITVVDGYERDACAWRRLGGRCALSASAGEAAALAAYAADLARPRDGRPYGKAAVLARDAAGAVAACVAPSAVDGAGAAVCLFATPTEPRPLELRVLNDDGSVASSLRVAGAAPASLGDALVVRNDSYTRDVAGPTKAVAAVAACALAAADPADAPKLRDYGAWLHARRKFAVVRRDGDRPTAWVKAADDGGSVEVWFERDRGAPPAAPVRAPLGGAPHAPPPPAPPAKRPLEVVEGASQATAASFYNTLKRDRGTQHETRIYHMRRFNNWVKSELIRKAATASRPPGGPLSVLDLACGKGGDLSKWANAKPTNYVGVDIAKQSLDDAAGRLRGMGGKLAGVPCRLVEASLGNTSLVDGESAFATWDGSCDGGAWSSRPRPLQRDAFHVASMQFAIHYMFETRPRAEALFRDLGLALRAGGRFVATTIDARALARAALARGRRATPETPFAVGEGPWWRVDVDDEAPVDARKGLSAVAEAKAARAERRVLSVWLEDATYEKLRGAADAGDGFGLRYWFQLRDGDDALAVDSPEWLAPLPVLQELAQAAGLELIRADPFPSFLELRRGEDPAGFARSVDKMGVPDRAGSLSPAEWDVLSLYVALEFVKKADAPVAAAPDPFVLAFPRVKRDWGDGWKTLDKARQLHLVALCARGEDGWRRPPPAPASLAVTERLESDAPFGD